MLDICMSVCCLVLLYTLYGFVENVIVVRMRAKVGAVVMCIARKILYSHVYLVCIHAHI